jgi:hypothetical protein
MKEYEGDRKVFNPEKLKIGDVFYSVEERNTVLHRKKIHQEIDGEDWFKYDTPLRTYTIKTWEVLGIIRKELEGQWMHDRDGIDTANEYCVRYMDETDEGTTVEDFIYNDRNYFVDKADALLYKEYMEHKAKEMDLKETS